MAVAGCGSVEDAGRTFPVPSVGPSMTVSPAVNQTRTELVGVLGQHGLQLADTQTPVRLAESPLLTTAPRAVYQVVLPKDPDKGYIVVYEFSDPSLAAAAAAEQQAYLGSGPGRVQTPQGTITRHPAGRIDRRPVSVAAGRRPGSLGARDPGRARDARDRVPGRDLIASSRPGLAPALRPLAAAIRPPARRAPGCA